MHEIRELVRGAEDYPAALLDLKNPPKRLWVRGELPREPAVAIVGTRRASPEALAFTERLAAELSSAGVSVVSGGAEGIDGAAHRGAMERGRTLVVHATSFDDLFPPSHRKMFGAIVEHGGAWLTETPAGAPNEAWRFLARNRLIAALARIVVVVQAPARSGALSTAKTASELGRTILAVPAAPWDRRGEGTLGLIERGARICRRSSDVMDLLGLPGVPIDPPPKAVLQGEKARVLRALSDGPAHVDELVRRLELSAARVQIALIELSMAGLVRQSAGRWHAAAR